MTYTSGMIGHFSMTAHTFSAGKSLFLNQHLDNRKSRTGEKKSWNTHWL